MRGSAKEDEPSGNEADLKSLVRNPRKFDAPLEDLLQKEEIYCHVCFRMHDKKHERKSPERDPVLRFIWCFGCLTPVHLVCHGIETPHENVITDFGEEVTMFACDRCRFLSPYNPPACSVCKISGGIQKRTTNEKWVHITCGLYSEEWTVYDFKSMEIGPEIEQNRPGKKARSQRKKCDYCKTSDNVIQCINSDCGLYTHFYCALKNKIPFLAKDEETKGGWTLYLEAGKVDDIWTSFDASDENLKKELLALYKSGEKVLNGLGESEILKLKSSRFEEVKGSEKSSALSNKQTNKQYNRESNPYEKALKEEIRIGIKESASMEDANETIFVQLYKKVQGRVFEILAKREKSSNVRGGKFFFQCPTHRSEDIFCFCKKPYDPLLCMIRCDYCSNWFHVDCVGLGPEEASSVPEYFCQNCKDWFRYKMSSLYPPKDQQQMDIEKEAFFVPKYLYKYYLCDLIEIAVILEKRVTMDAISTAEVIEIAKQLPLNVQGVLALSFRKQIIKEATDMIIAFFINKRDSELPPQPNKKDSEVLTHLAVYKSNRRTNEAVMKKNNEAVERSKGVESNYTKKNLQGTKSKDILDKKTEQAQWLKSVTELVSRKTTFEEVKKLIEQADRMQIKTSESTERQHLERILQSALLFFHQQKNFFSGRVNSINAESQLLQDFCENAANSESFEVAEQLFSVSLVKFKELIEKRISLIDLEMLVSRAKGLDIGFPELLPALETELYRVKYWRSLTQPLIFSEFVAYIKEMCSLAVFFPEMLQQLDRFEKCKRLQLRLLYFLKSTEHVVSRNEQSTSSGGQNSAAMMEESEEHQQEGRAQKTHLKYAKELKQQIESQEIKFEEEFQQLKDKIRYCEAVQFRIQRSLEAQIDPHVLKALQKDADKAAFTFSELEELQNKIKLYRDMTDIMERPAQLSELQEKLTLAKSVFKTDARVLNEIETKINRGRFFQEKAETLLSQREFTKEDALDKALTIVNDLNVAKIDIPQKEPLLSLEKSYKWMEKLYYFWFKKQPATPFDSMGAESSNSKSIAMFSLESSYRASLNTTVFESEYVKYAPELSQIVKFGQAIEHRDVRIRVVFEKYAHLVWTRETSNVLAKPLISPKELQVLIERAKIYNINERDTVHVQLKEVETKYLNVMGYFQKFKNSGPLINLVEQHNIEDLRAKITELKNQLLNLKVRNDEALQAVEEAILLLDWVARARNIYKLWQENKRFSYQTLNDIVSLGSLAKVPIENPHFQFIRARKEALVAVMEQYGKFKKTQSEYLEAVRAISQNQDENARRRLIIEASKKRPTLSDCKKLIELIKSSNLDIEVNELEKLENGAAKTEDWCKKLDLFIMNYNLNTEKYNFPPDKAQGVMEQLNQVRNQVINLPFQAESAEDKINAFEWSFHALLRLSNLFRKSDKNAIKDWITLLKKADEAKPGFGLQESALYRDVNEQVHLSQRITSQINELRAIEEKLNNLIKTAKETAKSDKLDSVLLARKDLKSATELKRLDDELNRCKIEMGEEKKYLLELAGRVKKTLEAYHQYCVDNLNKGAKEPLTNFLALQESFKRLPVSLINEERNLDQFIQKARSFQKSLEDLKRQFRDSKADSRLTQLALEQYKQIPIAIKEADEIQKDCSQAREKMLGLVKRVEELSRAPQLAFSEIRQLSEKISEINLDLGEELKNLQCDVWNLQVESIRKSEENVHRGFNEEFRIRFSLLKVLLTDGYSLLKSKNAIDKLRRNIMYVEQLLSNAEAELNDLYNIKIVELLESFHFSHQSFVDIKEEIIEYKVKLGLDPNYHPTLESSVRNIFQYPDEQIMSIIKLEKAAAASKQQNSSQLGFHRPKAEKKGSERNANEKKTPSKLPKLLEKEKRRTPTSMQLADDRPQSAIKAGRLSPETSANKDNGDWELKKKVKLNMAGQAADKVIDKEKTHPKPPPEKKVKKLDDEARKDIRRKLGMSLRQNPHFSELSEEQIKKYPKDIEMNLFSKYHEDYANYMSKSESIRNFLDRLKKFKSLSKMVANKHFSLDTLESLAKKKDSELPEFEHRSESRLAKEQKSSSKKLKATASSKSSNNQSAQVDDLRLLLGGPMQDQAPSRFHALVTQKKKEPVKKESSKSKNSKFEPLSPEEEMVKNPKRSKVADEPACFSGEEDNANEELNKGSTPNVNKQLLMEEIEPEGSASSRKEAILFDPDNQDETDFSKSIRTLQKSSYDPFNVEIEVCAEEAPSSQLEIEDTEFPKGSALKIFEGKFKQAKKPQSSSTVDDVLLLTTEDSGVVKLLPRFSDEIQIQGLVPNYEAQKFCEDLVKRNDKKLKIIRGWVICTGLNASELEKTAQELKSTSKFLSCRYNDFAGSYFFHPAESMENSPTSLAPNVRKLKEYPNAHPIMYFVIYERKAGSFIPNVNGEAFKPILMEASDEPLVTEDSGIKIKKKKSKVSALQRADGYSPLTSDEENSVSKSASDRMVIENEGNFDNHIEKKQVTHKKAEGDANPTEEIKQSSEYVADMNTQALVDKMQNMSPEELDKFVHTLSKDERQRLFVAVKMEVNGEKKAEAKAESAPVHPGENITNSKEPSEGLMRMNPPQPLGMYYGMNHQNPLMGQPGRNVHNPTMMYPPQYPGNQFPAQNPYHNEMKHPGGYLMHHQGPPNQMAGPMLGMKGSGRGNGPRHSGGSGRQNMGTKDRSYNQNNQKYMRNTNQRNYGDNTYQSGRSHSGPKKHNG